MPIDAPPARPGRAAPLPPDERRSAILRAVEAVVLAKGATVTTRDLAEAAGVAEGTLFRVFDDKESLVREAAFTASDPARMVPMLAAIDRAAPLPERLERVLAAALERVERISAWMTLLHQSARDEGARTEEGRGAGARLHHGRKAEGWHARQEESARAVRVELWRIIEPDRAQLSVPLDAAVDLFETLLYGAAIRVAATHRTGAAPILRPSIIVGMFLRGVLVPAGATDARAPADGPPADPLSATAPTNLRTVEKDPPPC